jgi:hypothetical protein
MVGRLETLLVGLRRLPQLRERKRGYFSQGSRAFLHFHEDAGDLYVDVGLSSEFQRMKVTSRSEQARFLSQVREALQATSDRPQLVSDLNDRRAVWRDHTCGGPSAFAYDGFPAPSSSSQATLKPRNIRIVCSTASVCSA